MEQVINTIIEAEKKAQEILNEAIKEKEQLPQSIETDIKELSNRNLEKQKLRLQKIKIIEEENYNRKVSEINEKKEKEINKMVLKFNDNCNNWVEILFNKILSRWM